MAISLTRRLLIFEAARRLLSAHRANARPVRPAIGAIRWDPWYSDKENRQRAAVEAALGPRQFHDRAPDFAVVEADNTISINGYGQSQIDREIKMASDAGLGFWAYCFYELEKPIMNAWKFHQASSFRDQINWCMILSSFYFTSGTIMREAPRYMSYLQQVNYQRVLDGRPLVFILATDVTGPQLSVSVHGFREACAQAKLEDPYIAVMGWNPFRTAALALSAGADAISAYSIPSPRRKASFADLDRLVRAQWAEMADSGSSSIPLAVTGKDRRPRVMHPVFWEASPEAMDDYDRFYEPGTPTQIAVQIDAMVNWISSHHRACPTRCGLIYSWNECDEGGSTLLPTRGLGDAILKAITPALHKFQ